MGIFYHVLFVEVVSDKCVIVIVVSRRSEGFGFSQETKPNRSANETETYIVPNRPKPLYLITARYCPSPHLYFLTIHYLASNTKNVNEIAIAHKQILQPPR
jgi:hypothetical protein